MIILFSKPLKKNSNQGGTVKERCRWCDCITGILGEWAFEGNAELFSRC